VPGWRAPSSVRFLSGQALLDPFAHLLDGANARPERLEGGLLRTLRRVGDLLQRSRSLSAAVLATETLASSAAFWHPASLLGVGLSPRARRWTLRLMPLALHQSRCPARYSLSHLPWPDFLFVQ